MSRRPGASRLRPAPRAASAAGLAACVLLVVRAALGDQLLVSDRAQLVQAHPARPGEDPQAGCQHLDVGVVGLAALPVHQVVEGEAVQVIR